MEFVAIILAPYWQMPVGQLRVLPINGTPLASHSVPDEAFLEAITQPEKVIIQVKSSRLEPAPIGDSGLGIP